MSFLSAAHEVNMAVDSGIAGICEKTVIARENLIWGKPSVFFNNRRFSKPLFFWKNLQF